MVMKRTTISADQMMMNTTYFGMYEQGMYLVNILENIKKSIISFDGI